MVGFCTNGENQRPSRPKREVRGAWQIRTMNTSMSRISSLLIEEDKENPKRLRNFGKMVGFPWLEVLFESSYCIPRG